MITDEEIKQLANDAGSCSAIRPQYAFSTEQLQHLARAVYQLGRQHQRESDASLCELEHVGNDVNDECNNAEDCAYNAALRHAANAIRIHNTGELK